MENNDPLCERHLKQQQISIFTLPLPLSPPPQFGSGHCYRVFSSAVFNDYFDEFEEPEILTSPIDSTVLAMKVLLLLPMQEEEKTSSSSSRKKKKEEGEGEGTGTGTCRFNFIYSYPNPARAFRLN